MTISMHLWSVENGSLQEIAKSRVDLESQLENWVYENPMLLNLDVLVLGRQIHTVFGGYIDILAINREGELVVIELKRDKTPRDIVAQCLDYASWVCDLGYEEISEIYTKYEEKNLGEEFSSFFDEPLPEILNENHQMIIIASSLDNSTERIITYLAENHSVNINAIFFNVFEKGNEQIIGRSFLQDPEKIEAKSKQKKKASWTGYLFVNTGIGSNDAREWKLNTKFCYISAGGGPRWINAIKKLKHGDKIFAYIKGSGYVGFGIVEEEAVPVNEFMSNGKLFIDSLPDSHIWKTEKVTDSTGEWLVRIDWKITVDRKDSKWLSNGFANQNVVCKLRDSRTFDYLNNEFNVEKYG